MKKRNLFIAYLLIGMGIYFLIKQLELSFFDPLIGWPTMLAIVGISFLLHSYTAKEQDNIFVGVLLLGLAIHIHGLQNYIFWYDHWSIYTLIVGIAFLVLFFKTKKGLIPTLILISLSIIMIFSITLPPSFKPIYVVIDFIETFWPVLLIAIGVYFIWKK